MRCAAIHANIVSCDLLAGRPRQTDQTSSSVRSKKLHAPTANPARSGSAGTDWPDRSGLLDYDDRKTIENERTNGATACIGSVRRRAPMTSIIGGHIATHRIWREARKFWRRSGARFSQLANELAPLLQGKRTIANQHSHVLPFNERPVAFVSKINYVSCVIPRGHCVFFAFPDLAIIQRMGTTQPARDPIFWSCNGLYFAIRTVSYGHEFCSYQCDRLCPTAIVRMALLRP
jgi:hypothetical protein